MDYALKDIVDRLSSLNASSADNLMDSASKVVGGTVIKTIDSSNTRSHIYIFKLQNKSFVLKIEYGQDNATTKEVDWYEAVSSSDFPTPKLYKASKFKNYSYLILEYIKDAKSIDELAITQSINSDQLLKYVEHLLEMDEQLFSSSKIMDISVDEGKKLYLNKFEERAAQASQFDYLKALLELEQIELNGKALHSPSYYVDRIAGDKSLDYLWPRRLGLIHGDLHFGNVLVKNNQLYCVDPNGLFDLPLEYDLGKLFHSLHGNYGSIYAGNYELKTEGRSRYIFRVNALELYEQTFNSLRTKLDGEQYLRGLFNEAMHFANALAHHGTNKNETLALFLRCINLFDELEYNLV